MSRTDGSQRGKFIPGHVDNHLDNGMNNYYVKNPLPASRVAEACLTLIVGEPSGRTRRTPTARDVSQCSRDWTQNYTVITNLVRDRS